MRRLTSYRLPVLHLSLVNTNNLLENPQTTGLALFGENKTAQGQSISPCPLCQLPAHQQLNQRRKSSLLQNMTVGSPPVSISSYRNYMFAFDRMNQSIISFPCAKVNSILINYVPLDYSLTIFIIPPPSHRRLSFPT